MKRFHSMLIAIIALVLFAPLAQAQPRPWDQVITNNRFRVLSDFNAAAVLDRETGLVWEQSPDGVIQQTWFNAQSECNRKSVGGRRGWRLPTIQELAGLVDPNNPGGIRLYPLVIHLIICSRPSTGRLLPPPTLPAARGAWKSAISSKPASSGVCADTVLTLSDLGI